MIPIQQTRVGESGNCLNACLASILEIPLWEIPEFSKDNNLFLADIQEFLAGHDLYYVQILPDDPTVHEAFRMSLGPAYHTIEGMSPRGGQHACVGDRGEIIFDPHPQDETSRGLVSIGCFGLLCQRFAGKLSNSQER